MTTGRIEHPEYLGGAGACWDIAAILAVVLICLFSIPISGCLSPAPENDGTPPETTENRTPGFSVSIDPVTAQARQGETITYTITIEADEDFVEPVKMDLIVTTNIPFVPGREEDLGTVFPPYPQTTTYQFVIPQNIPGGITLSGLVRATGGNQTHEARTSLSIQ